MTVLDNWGNGGKNFTRTVEFDKLKAIMAADQVAHARTDGLLVELQDKTGFMLRAAPTDDAKEETTDERNARLYAEHMAAFKPAAPSTDIEAMRATLKAGVLVVSAPQLFPTPPGLAARIVELAGWHRARDARSRTQRGHRAASRCHSQGDRWRRGTHRD